MQSEHHSNDQRPTGNGRRGLTRRQALQAGAAASVTAATLVAETGGAQAAFTPPWAVRSVTSFDESWRFYRGDPSGAQATNFDDRVWRTLDVPHDWRIEDLPYATSQDGGATANPSAFAFETNPSPDGTPPSVIGPFDQSVPSGRALAYTVGDIGWYRKEFVAPTHSSHRVELGFDGVYGRTDVWLNGQHLGFHPYGYTPFSFDLTPYMNRRERNVIAVRVDNQGQVSRWYPGSGIYRHTTLTITGPQRIPTGGIQVTTPVVSARQSSVHIVVEVANFAAVATAQLRTTILDAGKRPVIGATTKSQAIPTGSTTTFTQDIAISNADLWSPQSPTLYQAKTEVIVAGRVVDKVTTTFGIRSVEWNSTNGLVLNGAPLKILGGCIHHDHGPLGAAAIDRAEERTIEVLKAAGFNAIRASHNPRSEYMLEVCDRLGMLVWDEFSDVWDVAKNPDDYSNYFADYYQQDLTSMITRDRNHPSVIIWSIGNEIPSDSNNYGPKLKALVQSLDGTRAVTVAGTGFASSYDDVLDVHYANIFAQITGMPEPNQLDSTHSSDPSKAVTQSESLPATIYDDYVYAQQHPWMAGSFVWTAWDYLGEAGIAATSVQPTAQAGAAFALSAVEGAIAYPWFQAFSGDIDLIGQRKPQNYWRAVIQGDSSLEMLVERPVPTGDQQYEVLWAYYDELQSWTWDVPRGQLMTVHAYTSGDQVRLALNGSPLATQNVSPSDKQVATFHVPYAPGSLTATAYKNGQRIGQKALTTVGAPAALRLVSDVDRLTSSRGDLAHVLVEVVDGAGRTVPDAVVQVAFATSGAGQLIGVGNGNPHNVDSFQQPRRYTWHGQALAVLRPAKHPGRLTLRASAPGLSSAWLTLGVGHDRSRSFAGFRTSKASMLGLGLPLGVSAALIGRRIRAAEASGGSEGSA